MIIILPKLFMMNITQNLNNVKQKQIWHQFSLKNFKRQIFFAWLSNKRQNIKHKIEIFQNYNLMFFSTILKIENVSFLNAAYNWERHLNVIHLSDYFYRSFTVMGELTKTFKVIFLSSDSISKFLSKSTKILIFLLFLAFINKIIPHSKHFLLIH
jgi:hypothetical protein